MTLKAFPHKSKIDSNLLVLLLILCIGAGLRLYGLSLQSLWNDELHTAIIANSASFSEFFKKGIFNTLFPPLYMPLVLIVTKLFGNSETVLRLPSAFAGILTIYGVYRIGTVLFTEKEGLLAAAITATSWCTVFYSQEARPYAFVLLFSVFSVYYLARIIDKISSKQEPGLKNILFYTLNAVLCSYTHYFGFAFIGLQIVFLFFLGLKDDSFRKLSIRIGGIIFFICLPWLPFTIVDLKSSKYAWIADPDLNTLIGYIEFVFNRSAVIRNSVLIILVAWGVSYLVKKNKSSMKMLRLGREEFIVLSLILWALAPVAVTFIKSLFGSSLMVYRYLIISVPAFYLLVSRAITRLATAQRIRIILTLAIIGIYTYHLVYVNRYYSAVHKSQFRETAAFVMEHDRGEYKAPIVFHSWGKDYFDYYFEKLGFDKRCEIAGGEEKNIESMEAYLAERNTDHFWFIYGHRIPTPGFLDYLRQNYISLKTSQLHEAGSLLFKRKSISSVETDKYYNRN